MKQGTWNAAAESEGTQGSPVGSAKIPWHGTSSAGQLSGWDFVVGMLVVSRPDPISFPLLRMVQGSGVRPVKLLPSIGVMFYAPRRPFPE